MSGLPAAAVDAYASRWDDIMDPLGDDAARVEEFFRYLHLILTHKPATGKLIEDFLSDVLNQYLAGHSIEAFIDGVLAPYAMAWRILERPSDTVLPDDVRGRLEALNDYRHHEWKAVAMWALTHSFRNLGDPEVSFFAQRGSHSARDGGRTADPLGSHDRQRLGEILCALEQVAGVDMLNRRSAIDRRGHTAAAIRDLDKGFPVRLVRGLSVSAADRAGALIRLHGELQGDPDLVRLLLVRANEQRAGARIPRPRALAVVPIMPLDIASAASFSSWTADLHDYWMYRLGNMVLMQGKEGQIDRLTEYGRRRDRVLLRADSCRFPLTKQIADFNECTPAMLEYRQKETIRLLAEYWDIRYDESHADLTSKPPEQLSGDAGSRQTRGSQRVTIKQVVAAGLLIPGETLVWERPRKGERWLVTVTQEGRFRLEDGSEYASPTAAARAAGGRSAGLDVWKRTSNGEKLSDIWKAYRLRTR